MTVNVRILLVEDDAPFRRSLENFLRRAGYEFDSCATAREAMLLAADHSYSIVVVEYRLPDADGVELIQRLQTVRADFHAIYLSVYDFDAVAKELPVDAQALFLKKPFDPAEFERILRSLVVENEVVARTLKMQTRFQLTDMLAPVLRLRDSRGVLN